MTDIIENKVVEQQLEEWRPDPIDPVRVQEKKKFDPTLNCQADSKDTNLDKQDGKLNSMPDNGRVKQILVSTLLFAGIIVAIIFLLKQYDSSLNPVPLRFKSNTTLVKQKDGKLSIVNYFPSDKKVQTFEVKSPSGNVTAPSTNYGNFRYLEELVLDSNMLNDPDYSVTINQENQKINTTFIITLYPNQPQSSSCIYFNQSTIDLLGQNFKPPSLINQTSNISSSSSSSGSSAAASSSITIPSVDVVDPNNSSAIVEGIVPNVSSNAESIKIQTANDKIKKIEVKIDDNFQVYYVQDQFYNIDKVDKVKLDIKCFFYDVEKNQYSDEFFAHQQEQQKLDQQITEFLKQQKDQVVIPEEDFKISNNNTRLLQGIDVQTMIETIQTAVSKGTASQTDLMNLQQYLALQSQSGLVANNQIRADVSQFNPSDYDQSDVCGYWCGYYPSFPSTFYCNDASKCGTNAGNANSAGCRACRGVDSNTDSECYQLAICLASANNKVKNPKNSLDSVQYSKCSCYKTFKDAVSKIPNSDSKCKQFRNRINSEAPTGLFTFAKLYQSTGVTTQTLNKCHCAASNSIVTFKQCANG